MHSLQGFRVAWSPGGADMRLLVAAALLCCAAGAAVAPRQARAGPQGARRSSSRYRGPGSKAAPTAAQTSERDAANFSYVYSTGDGTSVGAVGHQRRIGDGVGTVMRGHYSYLAPDGRAVLLQALFL
ncbi:hypothetical protein FJT64_020461 [Amphibalanus amphitrite]|uniref:Uncharacterized protein n=1 Tax=Amphibalanus amphitrite TaxID=1232801 RepID=A0A6A4WNC9_AMPAM|nr:hypothetical protein FJT64_020461 [Amphibalanus amphitrite]